MSTQIAVLTDAHANLPALEAALAAIRAEGVTAVYHTGDAIGIGPFPAEVLDRLLHAPGMRLVMGNHDAWFAFGLPDPRPPWMSEGELAHQRWVHAQLDPALRSAVAAWPWMIEEEIGGVPAAFVHYALDETGRGFAPIVPHPSPADLDRLFARLRARLVFYGHQHYPGAVTREAVGRARYVNPDALGCAPEPMARYALVDVGRAGAERLAFRTVRYDWRPLFRAFEERAVPERAFIRATFFGGQGPRSATEFADRH
jgi:predicted phosphodiesterase